MSERTTDWKYARLFFYFVDHVKGGAIGALGDRDVDCAAAIDFGVSGDDVMGILDGANVAQKDGRTSPGADR